MSNYSKRKENERKGGANNFDLTESYNNQIATEIKDIDEWAKQILYWRTHLDVFIEDYFSTPDSVIKFENFQKVIVRQAGNCTILKDDESRGLGKTWKMGWILFALAVLYPESKILIVSNSVAQAINTISYIDSLANNNDNMKREIDGNIRITTDFAEIKLRNGSRIKAKAMGKNGVNLLGERAKIIFVDEAVLVSDYVITKVLRPILNFKRPVWWRLKDQGFEDYPSKLFEATSAYLRETNYYGRLKEVVKDMRAGDTNKFACCISYETGIRLGMIDEEKLEDDRKSMPEDIFEMEYGCIFKGNTNGSFFPYNLTSKARVLDAVELYQPKNSTARYVISLDVATSNSSTADNAVLSVVKFYSKTQDTFFKQLVYMASYKGYSLQDLANEIRKMCIRFPNTEKVIVDANAIGEGVVSMLGSPFVDKETGKEYPPFIEDTISPASYDTKVSPIIWAYRGNNALNNRGVLALKTFFENGTLQLPVSSMAFKGAKSKGGKNDRDNLIEEAAVYVNGDGLIYELSNIKAYALTNGIKYDVPRGRHKDRFSSLMMACLYIYDIEEHLKEDRRRNQQGSVTGFSVKFTGNKRVLKR